MNTNISLISSTGLLCALAAVLCAVVAGCATDAQTTTTQGTAAGAVIGAGIGALLGRGRGAELGAVIGGVGGYQYGQYVVSVKTAYADREQALQAISADSQRIADEARHYNDQVTQEIVQLQRERDQLQVRRMAASDRAQLLLEQQQRAEQLLADTGHQLDQVRNAINHQQAAMQVEQDARAQGYQSIPDAQMATMSSQMELLLAERRTLEQAVQQLNAIDERRSY